MIELVELAKALETCTKDEPFQYLRTSIALVAACRSSRQIR